MIYLLRHGQTDWNTFPGKFQGRTDIPLNSTGISQCHALAKYFADKHVDQIYSSPLRRAIQTAQIIAGTKKIEPVTDNSLSEQHLGLWEGKSYCSAALMSHINFLRWLSNPYQVTPPQGESPSEMQNRVVSFYRKIEEDKDIIIVSHLWVIRILLPYLAKQGLLIQPRAKDPYSMQIRNCSLILADRRQKA